jgi:hypothetical protein
MRVTAECSNFYHVASIVNLQAEALCLLQELHHVALLWIKYEIWRHCPMNNGFILVGPPINS